MSVERPYDDQLLLAELVVEHQLHTTVQGSEGQEIATLTEAQEFTAASVLGGLTKACNAAWTQKQQKVHLGKEPLTEESFRASWMPDTETLSDLREQHRPHLRYLRGVAGVRAFYEGVVDGSLAFDEQHYPHQVDAFGTTADYLENNDPFGESTRGAHHDLAGGSGKSRYIAETTAAFKSLEDPEDPNRVLIIAPDLAVQSELLGEDGRDGFGKYAEHLDVGVMNQYAKEDDKEVVIATINMVRNMLEEDPNALERFDLIIADEAHKLLGDKTMEVVENVRRQIIGVTGSVRLAAKHVSDVLPKLLSQRRTIEMIKAGDLAPVQTWICKTNLVTYQEGGRDDYSKAELRRISRMPERHQIAVDAGRAFFRDKRNGIFICGSIEEAEKIAAGASGRIPMPDGSTRLVKVVPVTSKTKNYHEIFKALNENQIQGVAIVGIDTGWNVPLASFEVTIAPSGSPAVAGQRAARLARRCHDVDGNLITSQYFELMDIIRRPRGEVSEARRLTRQITVPELLGETAYYAGKVIASPDTDGKRRDFSVNQFPVHIKRAVQMGDGIPLLRLPIFGAGAVREKGGNKAGYISIEQAVIGLGTTAAQLSLAIAAVGVRPRDGKWIEIGPEQGRGGSEIKGDGGDIDKLAEHLDQHDKPIV